LPLLTTSRIFAPTARCFPGAGRCEITRPFLTLEYLLVTVPARQCALVSARFEAGTVFPLSFGTMQAALTVEVKVAVTDRAWLIVTLQVPVPEQAPDQPANDEPLAGVAVSTTPAPRV
jgi:hypothetical protein